MKLIHLSDLHLGKRVNAFSMLEDQAHILAQITGIIDRERPDAVLIAGDVYDRTVPPAEAVQLFDGFLSGLAARGRKVFVISGNHDSPERIAFGARLVAASGVYFSQVYDGEVAPVTLHDDWGPVDLFLLPFVRPAQVRRFFPEEDTESYNAALRTAVAHIPVDPARRSVLVTHQFVTGALRSESEELSVGGTDNVDAAVFSPFDYVALGHLHSPQNVGGPRVRYCGSPLKYAFSEAAQEKSVTVVTLEEKGSLRVDTLPLTPLRELRELRGTYLQLTARESYAGTNTEDYLHITLTDEEDVPDAVSKLRVVYPNLMKLDYDNTRTRTLGGGEVPRDVERKTPLQLLEELYTLQNGRSMSDEQAGFAAGLIQQIWEGEQ